MLKPDPFKAKVRRWTIPVVRPEDLLVVSIEFVGFIRKRQPTVTPKLWLEPAGDQSFIILHFQGQSIAEQAFFQSTPDFKVKPPDPDAAKPPNSETGGEPTAGGPPVSTRLGGPSRLVFKVPKAHPRIGYTIGEVLDACQGLELSLASTALPPPAGGRPSQFRPARVSELQALLARPAVLSGVDRVRAQARLQRWEDDSDLMPVLLLPPTGSEPKASVLARPRRVVVDERFSAGGGKFPGVVLKPELHDPRAPGSEMETALEVPFRLLVSPNRSAAWVHAALPVRSPATGRCELWHTRLATRLVTQDGMIIQEDDHRLRTIRAIWARQHFSTSPGIRRPSRGLQDPFRMSLDAGDRWEIVHLSANFNMKADFKLPADYEPLPIDVHRLMLTSLGSWLDSRGRWDPPHSSIAVEEWRHRSTMARDHYVRVVYRGFLFPFGHRASLVKVTERKFHDLPGNPAILRQRMYIVVRQPLMTYGNPNLKTPSPANHRYDHEMPFSSVRIATQVTPDLENPVGSHINGQGQDLFWPKVGGAEFRFQLVAEDGEANRSEFTAPLVFVSNDHARDRLILEEVRKEYESDLKKPQRTVALSGQRVALADSVEPGDTSFDAVELVLGAHVRDDELAGADRPKFYPRVARAKVVVPAIKGLTGSNGIAEVQFAEEFLQKGLPGPGNPDGTKGQVFLDLVERTVMDFSSGGDRSGAMVQPNFEVSGISRLIGPVGGSVTELAANRFDPASFFQSLDAKMFGVVDLAEVIEAVGLDKLDSVPRFLTETLGVADAFLKQLSELGHRVTAVKAATTSSGIDQICKGVTDQIALIGAAIGGLMSATPLAEGAGLHDVLPPLVGKLATLRTAVAGLPEVPSEARKSLLAGVDRVLLDLSKVEDFVSGLEKALQLPDELKFRFQWKPQLTHWPDAKDPDQSIFVAANKGKSATLTIDVAMEAKTKLSPQPRMDIACRLHNFSINLLPVEGFLKLHFNKLEFTAATGAKADVNCEFDGLEFVGVLSFVEALRDLIPLDGFSDPPALDVSEKGIAASYSMALPDIGFGVFSLQNLSMGAGVTVPFLGDPLSVRFTFGERQSPFLLTVSAIGGGGFFGVTVDPDGVQTLEASFEFGASLSVNFGVASGSIYVMGGIYFKMQNDKATLTGFVRMGGEVDVLGLVSVSIELNLGLTFEFSSGKCAGRATLTMEIEVALVSIPVEISCERKFAGSNGDPTFAQLMEPEPDYDPWAEYCRAFA